MPHGLAASHAARLVPPACRAQVIENVLQKPYTTLESYYDFWSHMESSGHATYFFTSLVQKLNAADKKGLQIALGVTSSSVLATLLMLALYYPVQLEDPTLKSLIKKLGLGGRAQKERASAAGGTSESMTIETLLELVGKAGATNTLISFVERCSDVEPSASSKNGRGASDPMGGASIPGCLLAGFLHRRWCASRPDVAALLKTLLGILRLGHPLLTSARAMALLLILRQLLASVSSLVRRGSGPPRPTLPCEPATTSRSTQPLPWRPIHVLRMSLCILLTRHAPTPVRSWSRATTS